MKVYSHFFRYDERKFRLSSLGIHIEIILIFGYPAHFFSFSSLLPLGEAKLVGDPGVGESY